MRFSLLCPNKRNAPRLILGSPRVPPGVINQGIIKREDITMDTAPAPAPAPDHTPSPSLTPIPTPAPALAPIHTLHVLVLILFVSYIK